MKKRLGRSDRSEGHWEKRHRQDISSHPIRRGAGEGGASGCRYQPRPPKYNNTHQLMEGKREHPHTRGGPNISKTKIPSEPSFERLNQTDFFATLDLKRKKNKQTGDELKLSVKSSAGFKLYIQQLVFVLSMRFLVLKKRVWLCFRLLRRKQRLTTSSEIIFWSIRTFHLTKYNNDR